MTERVVVIGGSGHAKVLVDVLETAADVEIAGFIALGEMETLFGYPHLGDDSELPAIFQSGIRRALVAIGDNRRRRHVIDKMRGLGFQLINAISPAAKVSRYATLGTGVTVLPGAVVNAHTRLADGVIINTNASVDHDCCVGECAHVGPGAAVAGCVQLDEGVFLGVGSSVVPGVSVGAWSVVGAGAAVVCDLPSNIVAVGVPAVVSTRSVSYD